MKTTLMFLFAVSFLGLGSQPTNACKPTIDYLKPSNYELVKLADSIILARTVKFDENRAEEEISVTFETVEVLKGNFKEKTFSVEGYQAFMGRSKEDDFSEPRPGALAGSCIAYD